MLYSQEWSAFLQTLGSCSARVSEDGANVAVVTLRGLENEMRGKVIEFLLTPIEQEKFIAMELGMLNYVQMYFHQLMADMNQVVIIPVQGTEICGLRDIFEAAWKLMSLENFQKVESACTAASSLLTDNGALGQGREEEEDSDNVDLYTAGDTEDMDGMALGGASAGPSSLMVTGQAGGGAAMALEEHKQLSLAIQNSLCATTEDDDLQRALELSKQQGPYSLYQMGALQSTPRCLNTLLEDMRAADMGQVHVFAGFSSDLIRADIALRKKVSLRQVEEKLQQKGLSDMSEFHRQCVNVIKRKHAVEIQAQGDVLTVSGFKDFVDEALPDVRLLLRRISSRRDESELLCNIQWARQEPGAAAATPYEPDTIVFMENTWRMKEKEMAILVDGQPRIVDLVKMQEYNVASGESVFSMNTMVSGSYGVAAAAPGSCLAH
ncbi:hypothetical protein CRUP_023899 [Coryphaenoides rupestris]|nr:hypothetical protein CRUP_023899 [Coryphaenoides rupestris]